MRHLANKARRLTLIKSALTSRECLFLAKRPLDEEEKTADSRLISNICVYDARFSVQCVNSWRYCRVMRRQLMGNERKESERERCRYFRRHCWIIENIDSPVRMMP